jgi:hypothetical protein
MRDRVPDSLAEGLFLAHKIAFLCARRIFNYNLNSSEMSWLTKVCPVCGATIEAVRC